MLAFCCAVCWFVVLSAPCCSVMAQEEYLCPSRHAVSSPIFAAPRPRRAVQQFSLLLGFNHHRNDSPSGDRHPHSGVERDIVFNKHLQRPRSTSLGYDVPSRNCLTGNEWHPQQGPCDIFSRPTNPDPFRSAHQEGETNPTVCMLSFQ